MKDDTRKLAGIAAGGFVVAVFAALELFPLLQSVTLPGQMAWYGARASGMVAYLLATASVIFGMAITTRAGGRIFGKANTADAHRSLSMLSLFAIGAHTLFLALDQYARFGPADLFLPFATWYRTVWTGLGIIAAYLGIAVYASFYLRSVIGYRAWRTFHYTAFGVFVLGTIHGIFAGSDTSATWATAIYAGSFAAVAAMFAYRMSTRKATSPAGRSGQRAPATQSEMA